MANSTLNWVSLAVCEFRGFGDSVEPRNGCKIFVVGYSCGVIEKKMVCDLVLGLGDAILGLGLG